MTTDCRFKMAASAGDTFSDANTSDILLTALNGPSGRAILAGFSTTGGTPGVSSLHILPNAVSVQGALSASSVAAGPATFTTLAASGALSASSVTAGPAAFTTVSASNVAATSMAAVGATFTNVTVTGNLTYPGMNTTASAAVTGTTTNLSNAGNFYTRGLSNVAGSTYAQSLLNAGPLSVTGGDLRIDNNGVTTMFINQVNTTANTNGATGYWHFASMQVGSGGGDTGGVDIQGSFSRVDQYCDLKFVSSMNNYQTPPYNVVSEVTSQSALGKVLLYLNTATTGSTILDCYIYVESYSKASFVFRGAPNAYTFFNPVATFGPAPTLSATYVQVYDTNTMSLISKYPGQLNVQGNTYTSGAATLGGGMTVGSNLTVGGNFTTTGNTFAAGRSNIGSVSYFSSIVDAGSASIAGPLTAGGGLTVTGAMNGTGAHLVGGAFLQDNGANVSTAVVTQHNTNNGDGGGQSYWKVASFNTGDGGSYGGIVEIDGNFSNYSGMTNLKCSIRGTLGSYPSCCTAISEVTVGNGGAASGNCAKVVVEELATSAANTTPLTVNVYIVASQNTSCNFTLRYGQDFASVNLIPTWLQTTPMTSPFSTIIHDSSKNANITKTLVNTIIPTLASGNITCSAISAGSTATFNNVTVTGTLTYPGMSTTAAAGGAGIFTTLSNAGNLLSHGFSNVGGFTYAQSLVNAGALSVVGGDLRLDNNGTTTMLIDAFNSTGNPSTSPTSYWRFASIACGPGAGNNGGLDIQGSFSRIDNFCDIKFVSSTNAYSTPPYSAVSELTSQNSDGKILMYLNTTASGPSILDYYIFVDSYTRANFTFRGGPQAYAYFNPVATFGPPPVLSATYVQVYDTSTMSLVSKSAGNFNVSGNTYVSGGTTVAGSITVGSNLAVTANASFSNVTITGTLNTPSMTGVGAGLPTFRNRIINGDMRIDQRFNGGQHASGNYVDKFAASISIGQVNLQQIAITGTAYPNMASLGPTFTNAIGTTVTTASLTPSATDYASIGQHIEGTYMADFSWGTPSALPVVLSFYVYSNVQGTYSASLRGNGQCVVSPFSVPVAGTWKRVVMSFPGNTVSGWATDTSSALALDISLFSGSAISLPAAQAGIWQSGGAVGITGGTNFMSTVGNNFFVTGVQFERGTAVTPFEYRPLQVELQLCQRYFAQVVSTLVNQRLVPCVGYSNAGGSQLTGLYQYPVAMRGIPTLNTNIGTSFAGYGLGVQLPVTGSVSINLNATDTTTTVASLQAGYTTTSTGAPQNFSGFFTSTAVGQYLQFVADI